MVSKETLDIITTITKEFFQKLQSNAQIKIFGQDTNVSIEAVIDEPQLFIGEKGHTLLELQHLLRAILRKKLKESIFISLDINDYKKSKESYLKELANNIADEVALLKKEKELPPMSASERRIIHLAIAERQDVVSESVGEEPNRRIIIKPRS